MNKQRHYTQYAHGVLVCNDGARGHVSDLEKAREDADDGQEAAGEPQGANPDDGEGDGTGLDGEEREGDGSQSDEDAA